MIRPHLLKITAQMPYKEGTETNGQSISTTDCKNILGSQTQLSTLFIPYQSQIMTTSSCIRADWAGSRFLDHLLLHFTLTKETRFMIRIVLQIFNFLHGSALNSKQCLVIIIW